MLILRPHHIKSLILFIKNKRFNLSNEEYLKNFRKKNGKYHDDNFIIFFKSFLTKLYKNQELEFRYLYNYNDNICKNCDIIKKCKIKNSNLNNLVNKLDNNFIIEYPKLKLGEIYKIKDII